MQVRMWSNRNSCSLLMEMQNGMASLVDSMAVSYKTKLLLLMIQILALIIIYKGKCPLGKYVHIEVCTWMLIAVLLWKQLKCPLLREWINVIHWDNAILFSTKKKRTINPWKDLRNTKYILLSERSLEKSTYCMLLNIWHLTGFPGLGAKKV